MKEYKILTKSVVEKVYVVDAQDEYHAMIEAIDKHTDELSNQGVRILDTVQKTVEDINDLLFDEDIYPYMLDED